MEVECFKDSEDEEYEELEELQDQDDLPLCIRKPRLANVLLVVLYGLFGIGFLTASQGWQPLTALYVVIQVGSF